MVIPFPQECGSLGVAGMGGVGGWGAGWGQGTDICPCTLQTHKPHDAPGDQTPQPDRKKVLDQQDSCQGVSTKQRGRG